MKVWVVLQAYNDAVRVVLCSREAAEREQERLTAENPGMGFPIAGPFDLDCEERLPD
jgi:hypothetical protein